MNFLACTSVRDNGVSASSSLIKEGDCVIVYEAANSMKAVYVSAKSRFENRFGIFKHKSWIGKPFGSKVTADQGGSGWVYLLRPTPELWTQVLRHRTQILYLADISMVVMHLDLRPGSVVLESGTGSGSLTHSLIRAVAPVGHVHTFEFHAGRAEDAAAEFKQHGLSGLVTVAQRNIEELGFPDTLHGAADAVFLDLPGPHKVVPSAAACLRPNGRFCAFSPCIEQVQKTSEALSAAGFTDLITYECLFREYEVHRETITTGLQLADPVPPVKRQRTQQQPQQQQQQQQPQQQPQQPQQQEAEGAGAGVAAAEGSESGAKEEGAAAAVGAESTTEEAAAASAAKATRGSGESNSGGEEGGAAAGVVAEGGGDAAAAAAAEDDAAAGTTTAEATMAAAQVHDAAAGTTTAEATTAAAQVEGGTASKPAGQQPSSQAEEKTQELSAAPTTRPLPPVVHHHQQQQQQRFVSFRPSLEARGHTGYLLFARKFVCG